MSNFDCEVCNKKIKDPLYWADPKFYDIPKKFIFAMQNAPKILRKNQKIIQKSLIYLI